MKFILDDHDNAVNTALIESIYFINDKDFNETVVEAVTYCDKTEHTYTLKTFEWADGRRLPAEEAAKAYIAELVNKINVEAKS